MRFTAVIFDSRNLTRDERWTLDEGTLDAEGPTLTAADVALSALSRGLYGLQPVDAASPDEVADLLNRDNRPNAKTMRSFSFGDIVLTPEGKAIQFARPGTFSEISGVNPNALYRR